MPSEAVYQIRGQSMSNQNDVFCRNRKIHPKIIWNVKESQITKTILEKTKSKISYFFTSKLLTKLQYSKQSGASVKAETQTNGIEKPKINPHINGQTTFDKHTKTIQWGKDSFFNKQALGKQDIHMQKNKGGCLPYPMYKN